MVYTEIEGVCNTNGAAMLGRVIDAGIGERVAAACVSKHVVASTSGALLPERAIATVGRHHGRCRASRASAGALLLGRVVAGVSITSIAAISLGSRCRITQHISFAWRQR